MQITSKCVYSLRFFLFRCVLRQTFIFQNIVSFVFQMRIASNCFLNLFYILLYLSFRCVLRQTSGRFDHPSSRFEGPPGSASMQLRLGGRQLVLGQMVLQPEGVLQIHSIGQPKSHNIQPPPWSQS